MQPYNLYADHDIEQQKAANESGFILD